MTLHWAHVTASYALVLGGFLALGLGAGLRHRAAKRRLLVLDPRAKRGRTGSPDGRSAAWRGNLNRPEQTP